MEPLTTNDHLVVFRLVERVNLLTEEILGTEAAVDPALKQTISDLWTTALARLDAILVNGTNEEAFRAIDAMLTFVAYGEQFAPCDCGEGPC